jgi:hypothetical protein
MSENNTPETTTVYGVTVDELRAHREGLQTKRSEAYSAWMRTPPPADEEFGNLFRLYREQMEIWDNMSDAERAEVIADAKTATAAEAPGSEEAPGSTEAPGSPEEADPHADCQSQIATLTAQREEWRERTNNALREQITGDDYRLTDFWQRAGDLAEEFEFCNEYDRLADAMGGPAREYEFEVEHEITVSVTFTAVTTQTASRNADSSDFSDWSEADGEISSYFSEIKNEIDRGRYEIDENITGYSR